jgi:hypothetical protein
MARQLGGAAPRVSSIMVYPPASLALQLLANPALKPPPCGPFQAFVNLELSNSLTQNNQDVLLRQERQTYPNQLVPD